MSRNRGRPTHDARTRLAPPKRNGSQAVDQIRSPGLLLRCRLWAAKIVYDLSFALLVRDASWQDDLFASLAPKSGDRILGFGPGSSSSAISLARRYPEATFVIVDSKWKAAERMRLRALRKQVANVAVIQASLAGKLPVNASSFDAVICMFALHHSAPDQKLDIVKEMTRVLRHGGTLRVIEFDKPENPGERRILELARRLSGSPAVAPHFNGSWVDSLARVGLSGTVRHSTHSVGVGRISIVKARKR
ncbi:class I SAM-dependent methyltransferase [Bradyrhizobium sp. WSM1253]|uniref:class I SAM-dependent methyltransferase n=1 Tax=Bradyrhizobium sp. WSM1253 TaxID=319003 RepID=UPI00025D3067|nr:methylase involved in ubiquinone/menaquinone biosynthesis [Bradyrhizobium sp. WSM1253]